MTSLAVEIKGGVTSSERCGEPESFQSSSSPKIALEDTDMTDAATETATLETVAPHILRLCFSSSTAQVRLVTCEPIHRTILLILARLARHDDTIDRLCDQLDEMSVDKMEEIEHDVEALQARVGAAEEKANMMQLALEDAWAEIIELQTHSKAS
ncbi:hypothetical protein Tco_0945780 [Tanacetum coccineum]